MTKKLKMVRVGGIEITPITECERRRLNARIERKYERLRKRYKDIHGKVVDWVSYSFEEGLLYISIRFKDKTDFSLQFTARIVTDGIDLSDVKTENRKVIREYYRRRDDPEGEDS